MDGPLGRGFDSPHLQNQPLGQALVAGFLSGVDGEAETERQAKAETAQGFAAWAVFGGLPVAKSDFPPPYKSSQYFCFN